MQVYHIINLTANPMCLERNLAKEKYKREFQMWNPLISEKSFKSALRLSEIHDSKENIKFQSQEAKEPSTVT